MVIQKISRFISTGIVVALLSIFSVSSYAAATRTITFTNNTGQNANDLHIEFKQAADNKDAGAFGNINGDKTSKHDYSNGNVAAGANNTMKFETTSSRLTINRWWWTLDGKRIGEIQGEKQVAVMNIEQNNARMGDLITLGCSIFASMFEPLNIFVNWVLLSPSGMVVAEGSLPLNAPPGHEGSMQIPAGNYEEMGTYTLHYDAMSDMGVMSEGTSTVVVDDGQRPIIIEE